MAKIKTFIAVLCFLKLELNAQNAEPLNCQVEEECPYTSPDPFPCVDINDGGVVPLKHAIPPLQEVAQCPTGFNDCKDKCYTITEKTTFPPQCPQGQNVVPFQDAIDCISLDQIFESVWVPVTRDFSNGLGPLRWVEPSALYKTEYIGPYDFDLADILKQNCLIYSNGKFKAVPCTEKHPGICAYEKLFVVDGKGCNYPELPCFQRDLFSKTKCVCVEKEQISDSQLAEFIEPYQNTVYSILTQDVCNFGLRKLPNETYIWESSKKIVDYFLWTTCINFSEGGIYGAYTPQGWTLTQDLGSCLLTEKEVDEHEVSMELKFDNKTNRFILNVVNYPWLQTYDSGENSDFSLFCFTDAHPKALLYQYSNGDIQSDGHFFIFEPFQYPGNYWCEGFKYTNLENIVTEKIFARSIEYLEFVAMFQVKWDRTNPLSSDIVDFLSANLLDKFQELVDVGTQYILRIMKISDLDIENNSTFVNIHISSEDELNPSNVEDQFHSLQARINQAFTGDIKMVDFSSSDYCIAESVPYSATLYLTWPTILVGQATTPDQFCFASDGNLLQNSCIGDFMDGAHWVHTSDCTMLESSRVTEALSELYHNPDDTNDEKVAQIFEKYSLDQFSALDVYLIEEIFKHYEEHESFFQWEIFGTVLDNVLKIDPKILQESQQVARASNKLLDILDYLLSFEGTYRISEDNFYLLLTNNASGVVVETVDGGQLVTILSGNWTPTKLIEQYLYLDFAIWLSPELIAALDDKTNLVFSVFFNDALFNGLDYQSVNRIFGVLVQNITLYLPSVETIQVIQKIDSNGMASASCHTWIYNDQLQGQWFADGKYQNFDPYHVCTFEYTGYFGLFFTPSNVTNELEDLLGGAWAAASNEAILKLESISEQYERFEAIDVYLVGQVLQMVKSNPYGDLRSLAQTVDNLHRIDKSILSTSEMSNKSTDTILTSIDDMIRDNNQSEVLITTKNFVVFVTTLKKTNFTGLVLFETDGFLEAKVMSGDFDVNKTISHDNFVSAVLLTPELKHQLNQDDKIIITAFFSDVLFVENQSDHKPVGNIFGVILPVTGDYSGPVTIVHNLVVKEFETHCAHWSFDTTSFWKKDTSAKNFPQLTQCDFWHTTHFALLLLPEDIYADYEILDWITKINIGFSLGGVFIIILTAILFKKWRRNIGNQILLNMSLAILLQIVMFYIVALNRDSCGNVCCTVIGVLLQYSLISQFSWMLIIAVLQFKRFVKVFAPSPRYLLLKACFCGWVPPLIPVAFSVVWNGGNYSLGIAGFCYPSGWGLYLGVWLPVAIIAAINLVIFIYIVYNVIRSNLESSVAGGKKEGKYQWRLFVLLFFLLGVTWSFGFLVGFGIVFVYLFCSTATLQGFVLFLYFIVFNSNTRHMYVRGIKTLCNRKDF